MQDSNNFSYSQSIDQSLESGMCREIAMKQTTDFLNRNDISIYEKLQKITSAFRVDMVNVKKDQLVFCWLCGSQIRSEMKDEGNKIKQSRKETLELLLQHLYHQHKGELYLCYMDRVLHYQLKEVNLVGFFEEITRNVYKKIIIIDRQNAGNFDKPITERKDVLFIEVLNKANRHLAKSMYLLADSDKKDAADLFITIIVWEVLRRTPSQIIVITDDHFGEGLQDVVGAFFHARFRSVKRNQFTLD